MHRARIIKAEEEAANAAEEKAAQEEAAKAAEEKAAEEKAEKEEKRMEKLAADLLSRIGPSYDSYSRLYIHPKF